MEPKTSRWSQFSQEGKLSPPPVQLPSRLEAETKAMTRSSNACSNLLGTRSPKSQSRMDPFGRNKQVQSRTLARKSRKSNPGGVLAGRGRVVVPWIQFWDAATGRESQGWVQKGELKGHSWEA